MEFKASQEKYALEYKLKQQREDLESTAQQLQEPKFQTGRKMKVVRVNQPQSPYHRRPTARVEEITEEKVQPGAQEPSMDTVEEDALAIMFKEVSIKTKKI